MKPILYLYEGIGHVGLLERVGNTAHQFAVSAGYRMGKLASPLPVATADCFATLYAPLRKRRVLRSVIQHDEWRMMLDKAACDAARELHLLATRCSHVFCYRSPLTSHLLHGEDGLNSAVKLYDWLDGLAEVYDVRIGVYRHPLPAGVEAARTAEEADQYRTLCDAVQQNLARVGLCQEDFALIENRRAESLALLGQKYADHPLAKGRLIQPVIDQTDLLSCLNQHVPYQPSEPARDALS